MIIRQVQQLNLKTEIFHQLMIWRHLNIIIIDIQEMNGMAESVIQQINATLVLIWLDLFIIWIYLYTEWSAEASD